MMSQYFPFYNLSKLLCLVCGIGWFGSNREPNRR